MLEGPGEPEGAKLEAKNFAQGKGFRGEKGATGTGYGAKNRQPHAAS